MLIIFTILLYLIPSYFCFNFTFEDVPNEVEFGKPIDIKWNVSSDYKKYNFTINMTFCHSENNGCIDIATIQSIELNYQNNTHFVSTNSGTSLIPRSEDDKVLDENYLKNNITETVDNYITTIQIDNKECYFRNKPIDKWNLQAHIQGTNTKNKKKVDFTSKSKVIKRQLDCNNPCIENGCKPGGLEKSNREAESKITGNQKNKNNKDESNFPTSFVIIFSLILFLTLMILGITIYNRKFKKKEDDPIPIFSVEDSSYCYETNNQSPILSGVSYHSNILDKSLLGVNKGNGKNNVLTASPKMMDQAHLSVQLHPLNNVNDCYSHSSQHSSKTKVTDNSYNKNPQELYKPESNINYVPSNFSSPESPNMTALSPISMASTIPFISTPKPVKKKSSRYENNHVKHPYIYSDTPIIIEKKQRNSYLFSESPMLSETKSRISDKHSFVSHHTDNEDETKVLSSKHYVLSNFEGDYDKEELDLHYGDIVSVINILPDGWAYGELLLKYNSYDINGNNVNMKKHHTKSRKFGYYPIKCLSPEEESDESNSPSKKVTEKENQNDLKIYDIPSVVKQMNNKDNHNNKTKSNEESPSVKKIE